MKRINFALIIVMIIGTFYFGIFQYDSSRLLTYLAVIPVLGAPLVLVKTRYKLDDLELFFYYGFIFLADFMGCVVNLYNLVSWYDIFVHFLSGIFTFCVGLFILKRIGISNKNYYFRVLFCFCVVMFVAGIWELFEYGVDFLLGMDLQHSITTGVNDTMEDMLAAFCGGITFMIFYFLRYKMMEGEV